jgi:hypothetical protein
VWRVLNDCVSGTSHVQAGTTCQDSSFATTVEIHAQNYLMVACSDGAGTAKASHVGSKLACEEAVRRACDYFRAGNQWDAIDPTVLQQWVKGVREALDAEATRQQLELRDLACTLLMAVIGPNGSVYLQVGDGAIVVGDEVSSHHPVFWPQTGEYHNTTYFVTDERFDQNIQTNIRGSSPSDVALFTDGLQMLALDYATHAAHGPFFTPLFRAVRDAPDHAELAVPLRQFLESDAVNARTDDDKTLILAVRTSSGGNSNNDNHCIAANDSL